VRTLNKDQTISWFSEKGLLDANGNPSFSGFSEATDFKIPVDSGHKTALSRLLVSFCDSDQEAALWITEYGIWPSSEDTYLFQGFRHFLGEDRPLHEAPGHAFSKDDLHAVRSLVGMILYFVWGAILFSPANALAIKISHDEFITIYVRNQADGQVITQKVKDFLE
jgi:hypothetical protein